MTCRMYACRMYVHVSNTGTIQQTQNLVLKEISCHFFFAMDNSELIHYDPQYFQHHESTLFRH